MASVSSPGRKRVLYLTYDGLTDPIGRSQVLPYLNGCAAAGHRLTVVSFEKKAAMARLGSQVGAELKQAGIAWHPERFRTRPPLLAKWLDQRAMARAARALGAEGPDLIHARSYVAGMAGLQVARTSGIPLLFDMRGLWVDQRREGGRWTDDRLLGRTLYRRWKANERALVGGAAHIVTLTAAARDEVSSWPHFPRVPVSVIPCCADFSLFRPAEARERTAARARLGIPQDALVLAHLGSLGTVYLTVELLRLFGMIAARRPLSRLLLIGNHDRSELLSLARGHGIEIKPEMLVVTAADREQVSATLGAGDAGACLIMPTYSSIGVSATKVGEYLACRLPVFANKGVGDIEPLLGATAGHLLSDTSDASLGAAAEAFVRQEFHSPATVRDRALPLLDLKLAVEAYANIYARPGERVELVRW